VVAKFGHLTPLGRGNTSAAETVALHDPFDRNHHSNTSAGDAP
jgi:hypothetical protein